MHAEPNAGCAPLAQPRHDRCWRPKTKLTDRRGRERDAFEHVRVTDRGARSAPSAVFTSVGSRGASSGGVATSEGFDAPSSVEEQPAPATRTERPSEAQMMTEVVNARVEDGRCCERTRTPTRKSCASRNRCVSPRVSAHAVSRCTPSLVLGLTVPLLLLGVNPANSTLAPRFATRPTFALDSVAGNVPESVL